MAGQASGASRLSGKIDGAEKRATALNDRRNHYGAGDSALLCGAGEKSCWRTRSSIGGEAVRDPLSEDYHEETIRGVGYSTRWVAGAVLLIVMAYYMPLRDTCEITRVSQRQAISRKVRWL